MITNPHDQAHHLIDLLSKTQVSALAGPLESMVDQRGWKTCADQAVPLFGSLECNGGAGFELPMIGVSCKHTLGSAVPD